MGDMGAAGILATGGASAAMDAGGGRGDMGAGGILARGGGGARVDIETSSSDIGGGERIGRDEDVLLPVTPVTGIGSEISGGGVVAADVLDVEMLGSTDWIPDLFLAPVKVREECRWMKGGSWAWG